MKYFPWKKIIITALAVCVFLPTFFNCGVLASKTQDRLDEANEKIEALQREQETLKSELSGYGSDYDGVVLSIANYEAQIADKEQEITAVSGQIEDIEADIDRQYETMKARIKYTYENKDSSYLAMILQAGSVSSLMTRIEYASAIKKYDEDLINSYMLLCEQLEEKKAELSDDMAALESLRDECSKKREQLAGLIEDTQNKIALSAEELEEKMAEAEKLEAKIEAEKLAAKKSEAKLGGKFAEHAPAEVVQAEKDKLEETKRRIEKLESYLKSL